MKYIDTLMEYMADMSGGRIQNGRKKGGIMEYQPNRAEEEENNNNNNDDDDDDDDDRKNTDQSKEKDKPTNQNLQTYQAHHVFVFVHLYIRLRSIYISLLICDARFIV